MGFEWETREKEKLQNEKCDMAIDCRDYLDRVDRTCR